jgi:uncharacterized protein (TIGR03067 family)
MQNMFFTILALAFLTSPILVRDNPQNDQDLLQGTWLLISLDREGKIIEGAELKVALSWVIEGHKIKFFEAGEDRELSFELDSSTIPKRLRLIDTKQQGGRVEGIYKLEGDRLDIAIGRGEEIKEWRSKAGDQVRVYRFKRVK